MTNFDRILTSTPLNKTAAVVARGKGVHWTPDKEFNNPWQETPLPVFPYPVNARQLIAPRTVVGRLTVIGYGGRRGTGASYMCRCACGRYGYRRGKSLRGFVDRCMCDHCDYLEQMKAGRTLNRAEATELKNAKLAVRARASKHEPNTAFGDSLRKALG